MSLPSETVKPKLAEFATYARSLKGDEKGEAQLFLDRFFRALGHTGIKEAGATLEFRIAKKPGSTQLELITGQPAAKAKSGKKFADLLWPDRVLIEMKKRGEHLEKHYDQLFDYWTQIVPKRPPYAILCNFDEFWIYDLTQQLYDPVDKIPLRELANRWSSLGFLLPTPRPPVFDNNRVQVTRKAAAQMAGVFRTLVDERQVPRARAQRFILQLLVALVSEDLGLLPDLIVTRVLADAIKDPPSSYDLLGGLFRAMNAPGKTDGGRFTGVDYFNGGLFSEIDPVELKVNELYALETAAKEDWSAVKPEIFGTIFQQSMDKGERHAFGAHFTSEFDIQKVVGPTIVRPWRERIAAAGALTELRGLLGELRQYRVLDPACGSGNFLYVAYREMKRLERELLVRLRDKGEKADRLVSAVALTQFYGIDKVPFAVELARVTLMLAKELELAEAKKAEEAEGVFIFEKPLPLDNLDQQIVCGDALFTLWPKADAIVGNPPFQSKNKMQAEFGSEYVQKVRKAYPGVPGRADFCVYWFRKSHDHLAHEGRAGLVGTNTIRQNYSREGGLDYIVGSGGTITEAVSTEVWSGDAAVHVSVVNWIKGSVPGLRRLYIQRGDAEDSPWEQYDQPLINSALSLGIDVSGAVRLQTNAHAAACYQGQTHGHEGFLLTFEEAKNIKDPKSVAVIHPYLTADEMIGNVGSKPARMVIDLNRCDDLFAASVHPAAFEIVKARVLPTMQTNAEKERRETGKESGPRQTHFRRWWKFWRGRLEMLDLIAKLPRYIACGQVTKRPIFDFISPSIHPNAALMAFPFADDYSFGVLQSGIHWSWFIAKCSSLKGDFRYTSDSVFDTFPWPQIPNVKQIAAVAKAAVTLRFLRQETMSKLNYSLRDLYRTLEIPGANPLRDAHAALDDAVRAAYGMPIDADPLAFLLALNFELAAKEKAGEQVTPPGLPLPEEEHAAFVTDDCIAV